MSPCSGRARARSAPAQLATGRVRVAAATGRGGYINTIFPFPDSFVLRYPQPARLGQSLPAVAGGDRGG
jgi:hypothetical protein